MIETTAVTLDVSSTAGTVSGEYMVPQGAECILTLAHGAGAGMNHSFMVTLAKALAELKIATLRFNFPFIEQKKKDPICRQLPIKPLKPLQKTHKGHFPNYRFICLVNHLVDE